MTTNTTAVAKQVRMQQWAQQITDCQNRPTGMNVDEWCDANGITKANYYYRLKQVRAFCLESMEQKKSTFVELPIPTEPVVTNSLQTASSSDEIVATIHLPNGVSVDLKQSVSDSLDRTLLEASAYVK